MDSLEMLASAPPPKRPRVTIPDLSAYGRSVSDPPMSLQRRLAHASDLPVDVLEGKLVFPSQTEPRILRPAHSGPARYLCSLSLSHINFVFYIPTLPVGQLQAGVFTPLLGSEVCCVLM